MRCLKARWCAVHRFFYASSACIYPEGKQLNTEIEGGGLKEEDAWPAQVRPSAVASAHLLTSLTTANSCHRSLRVCRTCVRAACESKAPPVLHSDVNQLCLVVL